MSEHLRSRRLLSVLEGWSERRAVLLLKIQVLQKGNLYKAHPNFCHGKLHVLPSFLAPNCKAVFLDRERCRHRECAFGVAEL